jgi:predicted Zn-dependent protease
MTARADRARSLVKLDRPAEAASDLEGAEKADPADPSTHFLLAQVYRALGKTQEAQAEMKLFSKLEESERRLRSERNSSCRKKKSNRKNLLLRTDS